MCCVHGIFCGLCMNTPTHTHSGWRRESCDLGSFKRCAFNCLRRRDSFPLPVGPEAHQLQHSNLAAKVNTSHSKKQLCFNVDVCLVYCYGTQLVCLCVGLSVCMCVCVLPCLVPRRSRGRSAWYTLFAHALNLSELLHNN